MKMTRKNWRVTGLGRIGNKYGMWGGGGGREMWDLTWRVAKLMFWHDWHRQFPSTPSIGSPTGVGWGREGCGSEGWGREGWGREGWGREGWGTRVVCQT